MKKIRYLSLIELTAFYDALGVELKRNRVERVRGRGTVCAIPLAVTFMSISFERRCLRGCVSLFSHLLLLFLREWSFRSPSHRTAGEWSKEGPWNKSAPYLPKSEYHLACLVTKICFSTICIDTQKSHQIREVSDRLYRLAGVYRLTEYSGLKTLWQGEKICSFFGVLSVVGTLFDFCSYMISHRKLWETNVFLFPFFIKLQTHAK